MSEFYDISPDAQAERLTGLARAALAHWGIEDGAPDLIKYRENAVFRVTLADGRPAALRIHRPGYHTDIELRSEIAWIQALNEAGIDAPRLIPTGAGEVIVIASAPGVPEARRVDLLEWIDGEQLGAVEEGQARTSEELESLYRQIGALAARVHNQACAWRAPEGFSRHAWDVNGLVGEEPFWGRFWELEALTPAERDLLERARAQAKTDLVAFGQSPSNYSLIHADLVAENVLVANGRPQLIDFDDAGYGWHLFELATALYFERAESYFPAAERALIAGYRDHRPLSDADIARLPLFYLVRSFTYLGWVHTRRETETAQELTPMLVEASRREAESYLSGRAP